MAETFTFTEEPTGADAPQVEETQQDRPEGLPEKFNSVEDLAKSYSELESKLGESPSSEETTEEASDETSQEQVENIIGIDSFEKYQTEYFENEGQLSEESYKDLSEKHNFSKELVDSFIRGQESLRKESMSEVFNTVGGEANYTKVIEWASENLTDAEVDSYNNTVTGGDMSSIKLALGGLFSRYASENGTEPNLLKGGKAAGVGGYESKQQMIDDMAKPEYENEPACRLMVERKLAATPSSVI